MSLQLDLEVIAPFKDVFIRAVNNVFRRLISNLLLDSDNPKFKSVKKNNSTLKKYVDGLPHEIIETMFTLIGFESSDLDAYNFTGTRETLLAAEKTFSKIEDYFFPHSSVSTLDLTRCKSKAVRPLNRNMKEVEKASRASENTSDSTPFYAEDFSSVSHLVDIARKTLLKTGRVRNCLFDAKDFYLRRMSHGRVYACSEKCDDSCLEAHWHLISGKNILYSHVAHLTADGKELLHLGYEVGYQYHTIPGMAYFGKTVHFSTKLLHPDGKLVLNEHPNVVATSCIYCGKDFTSLFF